MPRRRKGNSVNCALGRSKDGRWHIRIDAPSLHGLVEGLIRVGQQIDTIPDDDPPVH